MALILGLISTILLTATFFFYRYTQAQVQYQYDRFNLIHTKQGDLYQYEKKLKTIIGQRSDKIAKNITTDIDYEISLKGHDIKELYEKIVSTYQGGLFFLVNATIEAKPSSISLAMRGFKVSKESQ
ncbi:MAG: hypothetical protein J7L53_11665 [Deltaproteobacteria bacterium]|nr:hypothetical protein [Deltaproteobacteria bacterium]